MSAPVLVMFDDRLARTWQPFALTRPVGELLFGACTQRARAESVFGAACIGHLGCDDLVGFDEPDAPPVLAAAPPTDRPRIFLCSRAVPDWGQAPEWPAVPAAILLDEQVVGWYAPPATPNPDPVMLRDLRGGDTRATVSLGGRSLEYVWELIGGNGEQVVRDFDGLHDRGSAVGALPAGVHALGFQPGRLRVGARVQIEPGVVLDLTTGPIWLDDDVTVRAFTRLAGPAYIGTGSALLGGVFCGISVGPVCKVHGEIEESVILGYSNKAHEGFLGHAYLGRWVNLGAMTTNSDLKNNYGTIKLWTPRGMRDTHSIKLGCFFGDHVKTAIGSLINTGTVVGAGSNLHGTEMPPKHVAPFSWGSGADLTGYDIEKFLEATGIAMGRRDVPLTDGMQQLLRRAWERGRRGEEQY